MSRFGNQDFRIPRKISVYKKYVAKLYPKPPLENIQKPFCLLYSLWSFKEYK